ncbi:MAG: hypothetical protein NTY53_11495 [Kiritimatiellaeota bacterium]|nr:hypothetical protein [Kiritimatiellota bacterium]
MEEIDKPFRLSADFVVAWILIAIATCLITHPWKFDLPLYSIISYVLVVPFLFTFVIYGPVLLMRQVLRSGRRGWFVGGVFLQIIVAIGCLLGVMEYFGLARKIHGALFSGLAVIYLNYQIYRKC